METDTIDAGRPASPSAGSNSRPDYPTYSREEAYAHVIRNRPESEQELYIIADELLFNVWDPLCLSIDQEFREEYLPYLPHVFDLLLNTVDGLDLYDYLVHVEETAMNGFSRDTVARRRASRLVNLLLRYRKLVFNKAPTAHVSAADPNPSRST